VNVVQEKIRGVRTFLGEVSGEMKKSAWPERQELVESTIVVIISMLLLSAFVGISDKILLTMLGLLIPSA